MINIGTEKWLQGAELREVMNALGSDEGYAKIVGGAVRDALFNVVQNRNRSIGDIDIASELTPDENIKRLEVAGIKVIPTGIKYGTVTAVINKKPFEITTLRHDVKTDGRHAKVKYTDDWLADAKRRDFTMNALYLDMDGNVHDPLKGLADIKAGKVRFIGDAEKRIKEDALRILRLFRFSSEYDDNGVDEEGILASIEHKSMIRDLSGERIWQEFKKILCSRQAMHIIEVLSVIGLLDEILPGHSGYEPFQKYVSREVTLGQMQPIGRLSVLLENDAALLKQTCLHLKLSNKARDQLFAYAANYPRHDLKEKTLRRVIYKYGKDIVIHNLIKNDELDVKTIKFINSYQIPTFPLRGQDLIKQGYKAGPEMGTELKRREQQWIDADFKEDGY